MEDVLLFENRLLSTLGFLLDVKHPHTFVIRACGLVKASKELAKLSYFLASVSLHMTRMCLEFKPSTVACVCIHIACKWSGYKVGLCDQGREYIYYVDPNLTWPEIESVTNEFLSILEKHPKRLNTLKKLYNQDESPSDKNSPPQISGVSPSSSQEESHNSSKEMPSNGNAKVVVVINNAANQKVDFKEDKVVKHKSSTTKSGSSSSTNHSKSLHHATEVKIKKHESSRSKTTSHVKSSSSRKNVHPENSKANVTSQYHLISTLTSDQIGISGAKDSSHMIPTSNLPMSHSSSEGQDVNENFPYPPRDDKTMSDCNNSKLVKKPSKIIVKIPKEMVSLNHQDVIQNIESLAAATQKNSSHIAKLQHESSTKTVNKAVSLLKAKPMTASNESSTFLKVKPVIPQQLHTEKSLFKVKLANAQQDPSTLNKLKLVISKKCLPKESSTSTVPKESSKVPSILLKVKPVGPHQPSTMTSTLLKVKPATLSQESSKVIPEAFRALQPMQLNPIKVSPSMPVVQFTATKQTTFQDNAQVQDSTKKYEQSKRKRSPNDGQELSSKHLKLDQSRYNKPAVHSGYYHIKQLYHHNKGVVPVLTSSAIV